MASRAKSIVLIIVILLAAVAAGVYYLSANLNGIVAGLIETQGSAATQTAVRVSGVDIRLAEATASLSGLSVANPEGFTGQALELGNLSVSLDPGSLTADTIIVKEILVDGARVNVLQQGASNNLRALLDNLPAGDDEEAAPETTEAGKKLIIERFILSGASASVSIPELGENREVELPRMVIADIGRTTNGATAAQVAQQLLRPVLNAAISSAATGAVKEQIGEKVGEAMGGLLKGLRKKKDDE